MNKRPLVLRKYGDIDLARGMRVKGGVYGDIEVIARYKHRRQSKCFPQTASLIERLAWQHGMVEQLRLSIVSPRRRPTRAPSTATFAEDIDRYLLSLNEARQARAGQWLRYWRQWYGTLRRDEIDLQQCQAFFEYAESKTGRPFGPAAKNKLRTYAINVWRYCDGKRHTCPCLDIPLWAEPVGATREIAPKEIAAILAEMGDTANKARAGLLYVTGCRPIELTWLGPESFRLDEPTPYVCITGAKGGKNRMVPLPAFGVPYAEAFLRHQAWRPTQSLGSEMRAAAKRLGLQVRVPGKRAARITPYALRHTYAMQLRRAGAGLDDIADALGHHSLETTRRYAQAIPERQAKVTGAMWAAIGTA